jgi:hypothetical protein
MSRVPAGRCPVCWPAPCGDPEEHPVVLRNTLGPREFSAVQEHVIREVVHEVSERDRLFFEQSPGLDEYERPFVPGELPPPDLPQPPAGFSWELTVQVRQVEPGFRIRRFSFAALVDAEEARA